MSLRCFNSWRNVGMTSPRCRLPTTRVRPLLTFLLIVSTNVGRIKLRYVNLNNSYNVTLVQLCRHIHIFVCRSYWLWNGAIFWELNRRRNLWELFCYGPRGRMNTWLFLSKLMGIARRGVLRAGGMWFWKHLVSMSMRWWQLVWKMFRIFEGHVFLYTVIRQNVNMVTNAILYSGLTPTSFIGWPNVDIRSTCRLRPWRAYYNVGPTKPC